MLGAAYLSSDKCQLTPQAVSRDLIHTLHRFRNAPLTLYFFFPSLLCLTLL